MITAAVKKLGRIVTGKQWETIRMIWPYKEGWGVWNPATRTVVETGIPKEQAQVICDQMNGITDESAATEPSASYVNQ